MYTWLIQVKQKLDIVYVNVINHRRQIFLHILLQHSHQKYRDSVFAFFYSKHGAARYGV